MKLGILGGGPAGYSAAFAAARTGCEVAIIEKRERLGGVCLNEGCIPTKTYVKTARIRKLFNRSAEFGFEASSPDINWEKLFARKERVVRLLTAGVGSLARKRKVAIYRGEGKLLPPANILVNGENLSFDSVIIATGTEASAPPIPGLSETDYWTNREALNTRALPHSIAIIGAGVVGVEFAYIFSAFGVPVTIFEIMPDILPGMDREISSTLKRALQKDGVKIYTSCHISRVEKDELFRLHFRVENGEEESLSFEQLLVATGREASFPGGMKRLGIEQEKNRILVNNYLATSNPRFFAAGDIIGGALLAHIAYYEGELAVRNALGANEAVDYTGIPSAIFSTLEIGTAGLSEERAREIAGDGIRVGRFPYSALGRAMAEGRREGFVKLIVDKNDNILGIHAIGEGAGEMLAAFSVAVRNRMKLTSIQETIFAHPTYSEALGEAALAVDGKARHI